MDYVVPAAPQPSLPVAGTAARFPVRRIYCVGRNYLAHVREMGHDEKSPPFFFAKASDMIVEDGATVAYPPLTSNYHHEVELVVAIGKSGENIPVDAALDHIYGYAVGFDMTRRDLQQAAAKKGQPWEIGKLRSLRAVRNDSSGSPGGPSERRRIADYGQRAGAPAVKFELDDLGRAAHH